MGFPSPPNTGVLLKCNMHAKFCILKKNLAYLLMGLGKVFPKSWSTNWAKKTKLILVKSSDTLLLFVAWPSAKEIRLLITLGLGKGSPVARLTRNWLTPSEEQKQDYFMLLRRNFAWKKERNFDLSNLQVEVLSMEVPLIPNVLYQESDYYKPLNEAWQIGDLQKSCFGILDGTPKGPSPLDFSNDSSRASFGWKVPNFINLTVISKIIGPTQVH